MATNNQDQDGLVDLSDVSLVRLLSDNSRSKSVFFEAEFKNKKGKAVVILEKTPFSEAELPELFTEKSSLKKLFVNDVYGSYFCFPDPSLNSLKTTIIYPATDKHIAKYESSSVYIIEETPEYYKSITLPCLIESAFDLNWVYNILEHKKEADRIVFEDEDKHVGFILVPDLKWDGKTLETLYLIAISHVRDIKSLRDLNSSHLPLLRSILKKGQDAIFHKYGLPSSQLRIFIHYQPSFYHLHVHFTYLKAEVPAKAH